MFLQLLIFLSFFVTLHNLMFFSEKNGHRSGTQLWGQIRRIVESYAQMFLGFEVESRVQVIQMQAAECSRLTGRLYSSHANDTPSPKMHCNSWQVKKTACMHQLVHPPAGICVM